MQCVERDEVCGACEALCARVMEVAECLGFLHTPDELWNASRSVRTPHEIRRLSQTLFKYFVVV